MSNTQIIQNWLNIKQRIESAALQADRNPEQVNLIAVSKQHPPQAIQTLAAAGQTVFGENYLQETLQKQEKLKNLSVSWHFLGRIQSNKAGHLAGKFSLVHSLDKLHVAQAMHNKCKKQKIWQNILIQVNVAAEKHKAGIDPDELFDFAQSLKKLDSLQLQGLMCMPPYFDDPEQSRPYFRYLHQLKLELQQHLGCHLSHLSMGMSQDYVQAIQEGATLLRIGTKIFGTRTQTN